MIRASTARLSTFTDVRSRISCPARSTVTSPLFPLPACLDASSHARATALVRKSQSARFLAGVSRTPVGNAARSCSTTILTRLGAANGSPWT